MPKKTASKMKVAKAKPAKTNRARSARKRAKFSRRPNGFEMDELSMDLTAAELANLDGADGDGPRRDRWWCDRQLDDRCELSMPLSVKSIAHDDVIRKAVGKEASFAIEWPYRRLPNATEMRLEFRRGRLPKYASVMVEIELNYPFTKKVPHKLRVQKFRVPRPGMTPAGDLMVRAAEMYAAIYAADERLGGESAAKRDLRLAKAKKALPLPLNRGFGPYIWGHDIGDLVFERVRVRWLNDKRTACKVAFDIGS